jgi:N-acetylneuraminate synthase
MNILTIAEIGMNHMGDEAYADQYLEDLVVARPDGLTFQVQSEAYYAEASHRSLRLSDEYYRRAVERTKELKMLFGVGLCDVEKVQFFRSIGTDFYKVLSKDIGNKELIAAVLATGKPVYISTGMSSEDEIGSFLAEFDVIPTNLSLIHTQLSYDDADTNLRAIARLQELFGVPVAFGSHSMDVHALYASLGFSPSALFFYVKGNRPITHRDEAHALRLSACPEVTAEIRRLESMLGDGIKKKMPNRIKDQKK